MLSFWIIALFGSVVVVSFLAAPRRATVEGFYNGARSGIAPGLWTLVFSQVTTWIFARSLMNSAILGYYYGMPGTLAYAGYYASFLTGGYIIGLLRARGATSVQDWLRGDFGGVGTATYNIVIALRLLSELFANLLVVGLIFAAVMPEVASISTISIITVALLGLIYSAWGGLQAALRTDVVQMVAFLIVLAIASVFLFTSSGFSIVDTVTSAGVAGTGPGWILLLVAALQVFSYPAHDPVMMDRGFVADEAVTKASFLHAFWLSVLCIIVFGFFGIHAAEVGAGTDLLASWREIFPPWVFVALMVSLLVSALSTIDSALASAARLSVEELRLAPRNLWGGRAAMVVFMILGGMMTLWGNATLFDAVAVSGTASMFLAPVIVGSLVMKRDVPLWSYHVAFAAAIGGAFLYFARGWEFAVSILPDVHKYEQLLYICIVVLLIGFAAVLSGAKVNPRVAR
jgi:Na+/proline symporter